MKTVVECEPPVREVSWSDPEVMLLFWQGNKDLREKRRHLVL